MPSRARVLLFSRRWKIQLSARCQLQSCVLEHSLANENEAYCDRVDDVERLLFVERCCCQRDCVNLGALLAMKNGYCRLLSRSSCLVTGFPKSLLERKQFFEAQQCSWRRSAEQTVHHSNQSDPQRSPQYLLLVEERVSVLPLSHLSPSSLQFLTLFPEERAQFLFQYPSTQISVETI